MDWPFSEPPNTAVFVDKNILNGSDWIHYVTHDDYDGAWQFHGYQGAMKEENAAVVGLSTIVELDGSTKLLADLPLGWQAWRAAPRASWERSKK